MDSQFFCENPRCSFFVEHDGKMIRAFRLPGGKTGTMKRLHVVQQTPGGTPKDFYFCENCANVLAMTFGKVTQPTKN